MTISREPAQRELDGVDHVNLDGQVIDRASATCAAWFASIALVRTPWFFWLDSDDELPADYLEVLDECVDAAGDRDLAYTDELVIADAGTRRRRGEPYSRQLHLFRPTLLHHLVIVRTDAARAVLAELPQGHFWPEMLLFWTLARRGAAYVPRVGYHWRRSVDGLSSKWWTSIAMMQSQLWCKEHP